MIRIRIKHLCGLFFWVLVSAPRLQWFLRFWKMLTTDLRTDGRRMSGFTKSSRMCGLKKRWLLQINGSLFSAIKGGDNLKAELGKSVIVSYIDTCTTAGPRRAVGCASDSRAGDLGFDNRTGHFFRGDCFFLFG